MRADIVPGGTFRVYNGYWYWGRPSIEDLCRDLREVTREIRPDWDLSAPGLREAWEAGDHSMHTRTRAPATARGREQAAPKPRREVQ